MTGRLPNSFTETCFHKNVLFLYKLHLKCAFAHILLISFIFNFKFMLCICINVIDCAQRVSGCFVDLEKEQACTLQLIQKAELSSIPSSPYFSRCSQKSLPWSSQTLLFMYMFFIVFDQVLIGAFVTVPDRMVVEFTTTYVISAYHHHQGEVYNIM